eukprot:symbB.v1.2.032329.t1/scaffold3864.1/size52931/3
MEQEDVVSEGRAMDSELASVLWLQRQPVHASLKVARATGRHRRLNRTWLNGTSSKLHKHYVDGRTATCFGGRAYVRGPRARHYLIQFCQMLRCLT